MNYYTCRKISLPFTVYEIIKGLNEHTPVSLISCEHLPSICWPVINDFFKKKSPVSIENSKIYESKYAGSNIFKSQHGFTNVYHCQMLPSFVPSLVVDLICTNVIY